MFETLVTALGVLDSLSDISRAILSAGVLAGLLLWVGNRLPSNNPFLMISFSKAALGCLLVMPFLVFLLPSWRLVVFVKELPSVPTVPVLSGYVLLAGWLLGAIVAGVRTYRQVIDSYGQLGATDAVPEALHQRLGFWTRRVGVDAVDMVTGAVDQPTLQWASGARLMLPRAAVRWPAAVQDAVMVHALCQVQRRHHLWLAIALVVEALYWPLPWMRRQTTRLRDAFLLTADELAVPYFNDRLGYVRGLRHVADRMPETPRSFAHPLPIIWEDIESVRSRASAIADNTLADPDYDRVFWALLQATLVMVVLTGTTLEKIRPVPDRDPYVAPKWYMSFARQPSGLDKQPMKQSSTVTPTQGEPP